MSNGTNSIAVIPEKIEFIAAEDYTEAEEQDLETVLEVTDWDSDMEQLANQSVHRLRIPRNNSNLSRAAVVNAFVNAFELIGGVPRLALWAHSHPTDFYKLYSRLLPSQASSALGESTDIVIKHVLPRSELDQ